MFKNFSFVIMLGYLVFSVSWLAFAYFLGRLIPDQQLWFALLVTLIFALPIYSAAIYAVTIQRIYLSSQFKKLGILHWLFTRRILAYIGWLLWSVIFAFLLLFYLGSADKQEWIAFFAAIPVFAAIYAIFFPLAAREYKPYIAVHKSLSWSRWVTALVMAVFFVVFINHSDVSRQYSSLAEAVKTESKHWSGTTNSILILETNRLLGFIEGVKRYALSSLHSFSAIFYLGAVFLGSVVFFFNIALGISSFMVPLSEYHRVFAPIQDSDDPPVVSPWTLGITSMLVTSFVFLIYVPSTVYVDAWMRSNPETVVDFRSPQKIVIQTVDKIENDYYQPGTVEQIEQTSLESLHKLEVSIDQLRKTTALGFMQMIDNVDDYLDWYYSLPGEYERIVALATGVLENRMAEKLQTYLMQGNAFQSIEGFLQNHPQLRAEHLQKVERILNENRVDLIDNSQLKIVRQASLNALKEPPAHSVVVNLENRMLISGGIGTAGAITSAIAGKITAKVAGKGIIKLGAQAVIKVTAGKTVSALGGAAAGAATGMALGSLIPGIGTAIGAATGGIIGGITITLTVEKLILMLEEAFSREEFKNQILEAIEEERIEFEKFLNTPVLLDKP